MRRFGLIVVALATLTVAPTLAAPKDGRVIVLYAGSLVNLMEHGVGPAFEKATGNQFQGYAPIEARCLNFRDGLQDMRLVGDLAGFP
jgi:hypothetical protein